MSKRQPLIDLNAGPPPRSVYVHVPFCRHRCGYCNFALVADRDYLIDSFLKALAVELSPFSGRQPLDTLYLGGGTPTHLDDRQLETLFSTLAGKFEWNSDSEVTIEANPMDLQDDRGQFLSGLGINRVSLGVQSFNERKLSRLDRDHNATQVYRSVENAARFARSVSIDLIFAAPDETLDEWEQDLVLAGNLPIDHVSTYELTYEKGTRFWSLRHKGHQSEADEELRLDMYQATIQHFQERGLEQYEISSFARHGKRSRHNQIYWSGDNYWGFGPGASGYLNGTRYSNVPAVSRYVKLLLSGERPVDFFERLDPLDAARELLAIGLRCLDGIDHEQFKKRYGFAIPQIAGEALGMLLEWNLLEYAGRRLRLTGHGKLLYDTVATAILNSPAADLNLPSQKSESPQAPQSSPVDD